jgi:renalase
MNKKIAIIGAGLSGLTLAEHLKDFASIEIFEKARGIGGRMSTRYTDEFQFDHGAQFFTARSQSFKSFLKPFIERNTVQKWLPKIITIEAGKKAYKRDWFETHYTAAPKMNMLCKAIAVEHNVSLNTEINRLNQEPDGWFLADSNNTRYGHFDWVISTAPAPQTATLLPSELKGHNEISCVKMQACYSLMIGLNDGLNLNWGVARVNNSSIGWMAVNSSKPLCKSGYSLLAQTTNEWAEEHIEDDQDRVKDLLLHEVEKLLGCNMKDAAYTSLHRWRYANTVTEDNENSHGYFLDKTLNLGACGDWCIEGHVESAYLSALSLANELKQNL